MNLSREHAVIVIKKMMKFAKVSKRYELAEILNIKPGSLSGLVKDGKIPEKWFHIVYEDKSKEEIAGVKASIVEEKTALLSEISYPESKLIENQPPKTQALDPGYGYSIKEDSFKKLAAARFAPIVEWMADDFDCNQAVLEEFMNDFMEKFKSENAAYRHWYNNQTKGPVKKTAGADNTNKFS